MGKDYFDQLRPITQEAVSQRILNQEPIRDNPQWANEVRQVAHLIPPTTLLINEAIIKSLESGDINPVIERKIDTLPDATLALVRPYLDANQDYTNYKIILAEQTTKIEALCDKREKYGLYASAQLSAKELISLTNIHKNEGEFLSETVKSLMKVLIAFKEILPEQTVDTMLRERILEPIWQNIHKRIQERVADKYAIEQENRHKKITTTSKEEATLNQEKNKQYDERIQRFFPEIKDNPERGRLYEQRREIAENIVLLRILHQVLPENMPKRVVDNIYAMLERYNLNSQLSSYPNRSGENPNSQDNVHRVLLFLTKLTIIDYNRPFNEDDLLHKLKKELGEVISSFILDINDEHPFANREATLEKMIKTYRIASKSKPNQPDALEELMQLIWSRGRGGKDLNIEYYEEVIDPIFFPDALEWLMGGLSRLLPRTYG